MIAELFKNKGFSNDVNNYREIMLGDDSGKAVSGDIRTKIYPMAAQMAGVAQFGAGFNGGETAFAHLYLRLFADKSKFLKNPALCFL